MDLTDAEKAEIMALIDQGEPLPDSYRFRLFREPREAELIWPGKTHEITQAILPFQSIEQIDEPRMEGGDGKTTLDLFSRDTGSGRQAGGWSNKLIWGDNKLVLSSLKGGPLRREIEKAGGLKLVYIDPPFDVGADFSFEIAIGSDELTKLPSVIEDVAYRDTWGFGIRSYISMMYERLVLAHDLLDADGQIYVHCDRRVVAQIRLLMDEVFGRENLRNEIIWCYRGGATPSEAFAHKHDTILRYSKTDSFYFNIDPVRIPYSGASAERLEYQANVFRGERVYENYKPNALGKHPEDWWTIQPLMPSEKQEKVGYPTQKPIELIQRIIDSSCPEGGLVLDFFCGSGTTLAVAEGVRVGRDPDKAAGTDKFIKYGQSRKWIGCDLGRFAIHTSRKRMIGVQRQLKAEGKPYRAFEILNLGKYERQWFAGIDPTLPEVQRRLVSAEKEARYVELILTAYSAQVAGQSPPFHGRKQGTFVLVGPVDAPVTAGQVSEAVDAARRMNAGRIDVLGFEFEMGLAPRLVDEAKAKGVAVALRYIPKDVFDRRAVEKGQVVFHDLAFLEAKATVTVKRERRVTVSLTNFGVSYRQEDIEALTASMKSGSKVTVDGGQVVKVTKTKGGEVKREILTQKWEDWIDYWAVDFDYASRPETIVVTAPDAEGNMVERQQWTGSYIFENEWQAFRTRKDRRLELTSATHDYPRPGLYRIAVKVIDIFGNDTTKVIGIEV